MTRILSTTLKAVVLAGLAFLFCTKIPATMDKLEQNIGATSLVSPADGSSDNILAPRLSWQSVTGATGYTAQVSLTSDFSTSVLDSTVADTFLAAAGLAYKTVYYWRVQVHDAISSSEWTTHRIFTTIVEPQKTSAIVPKDSLTNASTTLTLTWNSANGAASYCVQVASDTGFGVIVAADSTLADTSKVISGLANNKTYYWRVRSGNPGGVSAWTAVRKFTTIVAAPAAPGPGSPVNGAKDQPLSPVLTWNKVSGAAGYHVQVSTDITFTAMVLQDSSLTDTTKTVAGLANGVFYYWRVQAKNDGGSSAWSDLFGFMTIAGAPQQPVLCLPADAAIGQAIPLMLIWNKAVGAATYHVQVAADSGFGLMIFTDSTLADTSKSIGGLANNTKYFWRVRAKNPTGVSSWSTKRSFTTFDATLPIPVLRLPTDGASGQPAAPLLSWQRVSGANNYRVQVSVTNDFSTIFAQDTNVTDTSKTLAAGTLANNTMYYWRVRAENAANLSNWTSPWRFTTIMALPQIPALVAPPDGAAGQQLSLTLSWNKAPGATTYGFHVASDSNFANIVAVDTALSDTSKLVSVPSNNTTYYWRVYSKNAVGASGWSGRRSFVTFDARLALATLQSPQDGARDVLPTPTLSWSTVADASTYEVQVSTVRDFTTVIIDDATPTTGSKSIGAGVLSNSTTYYWKVMAKNLSGAASNWTLPWSFTTTITTPGMPVPAMPNDNAADQPVSLSLSWNKTTGAATYYVKVASDTGFASVVSSDSTVSDTVKPITGLSNSTRYYWKVRGRNASGDGPWSAVRSFTTIIAAPPAPVLSSPASGSADIDISPQLAWGAVTGAAQYHIQVSTASDFSTGLIVDDSTYAQTTKLIGPLSRNTVYYWQVKAKNAGGTSPWSTSWRFATIPDAPQTPVLVSPADAATELPVSPALTWHAAAGASAYYVTVAKDTGFSAIVKTDSTSSLTDTSKAVSGLAYGTTYYWQVTAKNAGGSATSGRRSFATVLGVPLAPSLVSPADASTELPVPVTLTWNKTSGATGYSVSVSTDAGFSVIVTSDSTLSLTDTSIAVSGLANGMTYFWEVQAKGASGASPQSSHRRFTTITQFAISITAVNGSVTKSPNQAKYDSGSVVSLIPAPAAGYHFAGWSGDLTGATSPGNIIVNAAKNVTANFAIDTPQAPGLVSPADAASGQSVSLTLAWNKISLASMYYVDVSVDAGFSNIVKVDSTLAPADTSLVIAGLISSTTYYWRVQAKNATASSTWSAARSFSTCRQFALYYSGAFGSVTKSPDLLAYDSATVVSLTAVPTAGYHFTGWGGDLSGTTNPTTVTMTAIRNIIANFVSDAPSVPTLISPQYNTVNVHLTPTLRWTASPGATSYHLQVATTNSFSGGIIFIDESTLTDTIRAIGPLSPGSTYCWHVQSANTIAASSWSSTFTFGTFVMPSAPAPNSPPNDTANQPLNPALSWTAVSGAVNYGLQVSTHLDFSVVDVKDQVQSGLSFQLSGLAANTKYYWRVKTISADTFSAWSAVRDFTTQLATPVLQSPSDAAVNIALKPTLTWNAVTGAATYRVQVSTASDFTNGILYDDSTITGTATAANAIGPLPVSGTYYWRVNAKNAGGAGPWPTGRSFTTAGMTWTAINSGLSDLSCMALAMSGSNLFAATYDSGVYLSTNNGGSWHQVNSGLTSLKVYSLAINGSNIFAGATGGSGVFLSTNNGSSWAPVNTGLPSSAAIMALCVSGNNIFAGTFEHGVYISTNNGASWAAANTGLTDTFIRTFMVSGSTIYAGTNSGGVFVSPNNGANWTAVNSGLTNTNVYALAENGNNIFAGTTSGAFLSTNNGGNWTGVNSGLGSGTLGISSLCTTGGYVFAGSNGSGVYLSTDNGTSWTAVNSGIGSSSNPFAMLVSGTTIFAATYSSGVFSATLP